jgi:hypothetical protein
MSALKDENLPEDEGLSPADLLIDPAAEPELQALLQSVKTAPPEDYFETFWSELNPRLLSLKPEPWSVRVLKLIKSPPAISVAAAVLVLAFVLPNSNSFFEKATQQVQAPSRSEQATGFAERQSIDTTHAKRLPNGGRVSTRSDLLRDQSPVVEEDKNNLPAAAPPMVLGAAKEESTANNEDLKKQKDILQEKSSNRVAAEPASPPAKIPLLEGYNQADYLVKSANLGVEVPQLNQAFSATSEIINQHGGYIVSSQMSRPEQGPASAQISFKVPKQHFLKVIEKIEKTGEVRNKQIHSEDLWLQVQRQKLDQADLQGRVDENKGKPDQRALKRQLKEAELKKQEFEQMLRMASLELQLTQKAPSRFWNLDSVGEQLQYKLNRALGDTLKLLVEILVFLPPLLIYFGCAWLLWLLLKLILVQRLALLNSRALAIAYLLGLLFFPLALGGKELFRATLLFAALLAAGNGIKLLLQRWRKPTAVEPAPLDPEDLPPA